MTEIDYTNARPLDVHRWSEYPEVNDLVGHVFTDLQSINGNSRISKKLVKVILLDLYVAWCADSRLMLMFSRDNNAYKSKSRYNEPHIGKKIIGIVDALIANGVIGQQLGFNDRVSGIGFESRLWASNKLVNLLRKLGSINFIYPITKTGSRSSYGMNPKMLNNTETRLRPRG